MSNVNAKSNGKILFFFIITFGIDTISSLFYQISTV